MATYNAGTVVAGTPVITIVETGGTYICDDFEVTQPSKEIERTDNADLPSGLLVYSGFRTATGTFQLASTASLIPQIGQTFTHATQGAGATTYTYAITSVGVPQTKGGETKVRVSAKCVTFPQ